MAAVRLLRWSDEDPHDGGLSRDMAADLDLAARLESAPSPLSCMPDNSERVRALLAQRKERRSAFGPFASLFQEPAWDILLELYLLHLSGTAPPSTSVSYATGVPISTALRWIRHLSAKGLVRSVLDGNDARVRRVSLTPNAISMMERYLERV